VDLDTFFYSFLIFFKKVKSNAQPPARLDLRLSCFRSVFNFCDRDEISEKSHLPERSFQLSSHLLFSVVEPRESPFRSASPRPSPRWTDS